MLARFAWHSYCVAMSQTEYAPEHLNSRAGRLRAWLHFYFKDHQLLRVYWWNLIQIAPGFWRSNQPSPGRLARYKDMGIRTVVSLRGKMPHSFNLFEAEACTELGLEFHHLPGVTARELRPAKTILRVVDDIAKLPRPLVFHCKSGADRTGFIAAIVLILIEGVPVAEAAEQLAAKHIHFKRSKSGVLDHVFRVYLKDVAPTGLGFREWLETGYDPQAIEADFKEWRAGAGRWT